MQRDLLQAAQMNRHAFAAKIMRAVGDVMHFLRAVEALDRVHDGVRRLTRNRIKRCCQMPRVGSSFLLMDCQQGALMGSRLPHGQDTQQQQCQHRYRGMQDGHQAGMLVEVGDKGLNFRNFVSRLESRGNATYCSRTDFASVCWATE